VLIKQPDCLNKVVSEVSMMVLKVAFSFGGRRHQNPDGVVVPGRHLDVHPLLDVQLLLGARHPAVQLLDAQYLLAERLPVPAHLGKASGNGSGKVCKERGITSGASATTFGPVSRGVWRRQGTILDELDTTLAKGSRRWEGGSRLPERRSPRSL